MAFVNHNRSIADVLRDVIAQLTDRRGPLTRAPCAQPPSARESQAATAQRYSRPWQRLELKFSAAVK
jgi:hypothetical protein